MLLARLAELQSCAVAFSAGVDVADLRVLPAAVSRRITSMRRAGDAVPDPVEMRDGRAPAGSYTDDTQMTLFTADGLLAAMTPPATRTAATSWQTSTSSS